MLANAQQRRDQNGHGVQPPHGEERSNLEQRFEQLRHEYAVSMTEAARTFVLMRQEFQNRDVMFEQLHRTVLSHHMPNLDILRTEQENLRVNSARSIE